MSTIYAGKAGNVSLLGAVNISSSTDATPIEITTAVNHGFDTGDRVEIKGHTVNLNANGIWAITKTSNTKFTLATTVATGAGAGGATGTATCLNPRPETTMPAAGELASAATTNAMVENALDREAWIASRTKTTIWQMRGAAGSDETYASWSAGTTVAASTWTEDTNFTTGAATIPLDVTVGTADTVEAYFQTGIVVGGFPIAFALFALVQDYGVAAAFASATKIVGSDYQLPASYVGPLILKGRKSISGFARGKYVQVYLAAMDPLGGKTYNLMGSSEILLTVYRNLLL